MQDKSKVLVYFASNNQKKGGIYKNFIIRQNPNLRQMSSDQEVNFVAPARNKLILDSEQQERKQQEERQREEQIQKRKQQKRKKRQQAERLQMEKLKQQEEKQKKYEQPEMMFEEDSDDGIEFRRVIKKIRREYPDQVNKYEAPSKKKNDFIVPDNVDSESQESESGSYDDNDEKSSESRQKNEKREKKTVEKKEKRIQKKPVEKKQVERRKVEVPVKKEKIKVESKNDRKENLVKQVSVRWWYALPEWPPADFDYQGKLRELGYRILDAEKFKLQEDIVNGLQKCMAVDGYKGVYKSKTKLIDVRPKDTAPTLNNFRSKSIEELTEILRKALTVQIEQLKEVKHQQRGESELLMDLQRQLNKLKIY